MRVTGLNAEYKPIKDFNPINLQWHRRYYEFGSFEMQLVASDFDPNVRFVVHGETQEIAIVNKISFVKKPIGEFVTLSGYLYGFMFDRLQNEIGQGGGGMLYSTIDYWIGQVVTKYSLPVVKEIPTETAKIQIDRYKYFDDIGTMCCKMLSKYEYGSICKYDQENKQVIYKVYIGLDRTAKQTTNGKINFSTALGNIRNFEYTWDNSNLKNVITMFTPDFDGNKTPKVIDCYYSDEIQNDVSKQYQTTILYEVQLAADQSETNYESEMKQQGLFKLLDRLTVENYDIDIDTTYYEYMTDYDLGDKVDIEIGQIGLKSTARIIGVDEVYKNNNRELKLILGTMRIKNRPQIRRY